jgi:A/G-specific adenine glycosylase
MKFSGIIRQWYEKNKRELPWRSTRDPYRIWLSEVILQQTRVAQGIDYYNRFVEALPDVASLAHASEDEVMKLWQGLGYYSRARHLHQASKYVVEQLDGHIPRTYEGLMGLKGVGSYTASAIASICFGEPRAVVDGNVSRVLARVFGLEEAINSGAGSRAVATLAREMLEEEVRRGVDPGTHNQAMMEFGAMQCVPVSPECHTCPLAGHCNAHATGRVEMLPVKIPKRKPVDRYMYFYQFLCNGETILTRRGEDDIWKSLYLFPVVEPERSLGEGEIVQWLRTKVLPGRMDQGTDGIAGRVAERSGPYNVTIQSISAPITHPLTHRTIRARFIRVRLDAWPDPLPGGWIRIPVESVDSYPVPRLIHRFLQEHHP